MNVTVKLSPRESALRDAKMALNEALRPGANPGDLARAKRALRAAKAIDEQAV